MKKGTKIEGYELILEEELNDISSLGLIYKHKKTGAKVAVITNEDVKKTFSIAFKTPSTDSTGVAHIVEHSVLCGSKKYNCKDPFVELCKGSLQLYLNAQTESDITYYPIVTYNAKEFHNIMDVYLDSVFHPNIYKDENIFKREGWHYELNSEDDDIKVNGIVYNEMKGIYSDFGIYLNDSVNKSLFKNDFYNNSFGGDPEYITDLTYEDFLEFHSKYYHPSNCHIYMYGDMNFKEELKFIDKEYLSNFEYKEIDLGSFGSREIEVCKDLESYYPISKNEDENNKTILSYNFNIDNTLLDMKKQIAAAMIINVLTDPTSPLIKNLNNNGFYTTAPTTISSLDTILCIMNLNSNKEDKDKFVSVIQNSLKKIVDEGIDKELLMSTIKYYEFYFKEAEFNVPEGYNYFKSVMSNWIYSDYNPFMSLHINETFTFLKDMVNTNYYEEFIKEYLIDNPVSSVVTLIGSKDMLDNKEARINQKIKEYKNSLSKDDINKLIDDTKSLKKYQERVATQEELSVIPRITLEDIDKKARKVEFKKKNINDTTLLYRHLPVNDIVYFDLLFNLDNIPKTLIQYINLYSSVLGYFDTDKYTANELTKKIMSDSAGINYNLKQFKKDKNLSLILSSKVLLGNLHNIMDIIINMMYNTNYNNKEKLLYRLHDIKASLEMTKCMTIAELTASSHINAAGSTLELFAGGRYYKFISDLIDNYDEKYDIIIEMFNRITEMIFSKENILINVSYNSSNQDIVEDAVKDFLNNINEKSKYNTSIFNGFDIMAETNFATPDKLKVTKRSIDALIVPGNVQYIALASDYIYNKKYDGYIKVLNTIISTNYLFENIRTKGGAYGAYSTFDKETELSFFCSYSDPNLRKTINTFKDVVDYVRNFNATEEEMEKYIIGTINGLDKPISNTLKNKSNISQYMSGITNEYRQLIRDQILNTTPEDIRNLADLLESVISNSSICVVGSEEQINSNKDLFDNIYKK